MADDADLPFWKTKTLSQMSEAEWESLCDGCGKCCLVKLEDEDTGELFFTSLHCRLLNPGTCQCSNYAERKKYVPDCVKLTPETIGELDWLPQSCGYRLVHEGKDLKDWHHLVCGDREEVHRRGVSGRGKITSEAGVADEDAIDYLIAWAHEPPKTRQPRKRKPSSKAAAKSTTKADPNPESKSDPKPQPKPK